MPKITEDPLAALTGLVAMAVFGILAVGGTMLVTGFMRGSWIGITAGGGVIALGMWTVFQGAKTIKKHLPKPSYDA